MRILGLLSEEVFDFSKGQLTQAKIKELKASLTDDFFTIFQLCEHVLGNSQNPKLIEATLTTLLRCAFLSPPDLHLILIDLSWMPLGYIFETGLLQSLVKKFLPERRFRNVTLKCLTEVASLELEHGQYTQQFEALYEGVMMEVVKILPPQIDLSQAYERADEDDCDFIEDLALFLAAFFVHHRLLLETAVHVDALRAGHEYLVNLSTVSELEVFKVCLEYWHNLSEVRPPSSLPPHPPHSLRLFTKRPQLPCLHFNWEPIGMPARLVVPFTPLC